MKTIFRINESRCSFCFGSWNTLSSRGSMGITTRSISPWSASVVGYQRSLGWANRLRFSRFDQPMRGTGTSLLMV